MQPVLRNAIIKAITRCSAEDHYEHPWEGHEFRTVCWTLAREVKGLLPPGTYPLDAWRLIFPVGQKRGLWTQGKFALYKILDLEEDFASCFEKCHTPGPNPLLAAVQMCGAEQFKTKNPKGDTSSYKNFLAVCATLWFILRSANPNVDAVLILPTRGVGAAMDCRVETAWRWLGRAVADGYLVQAYRGHWHSKDKKGNRKPAMASRFTAGPALRLWATKRYFDAPRS
jgi:hypothetical protein